MLSPVSWKAPAEHPREWRAVFVTGIRIRHLPGTKLHRPCVVPRNAAFCCNRIRVFIERGSPLQNQGRWMDAWIPAWFTLTVHACGNDNKKPMDSQEFILTRG